MKKWLHAIHTLLHAPTLPPSDRLRITALLAIIVFFSLLYGMVMGTFSGLGHERHLQILFSGAKLPFMILATFTLTLPPFFILQNLFGVRDDFAYVLRALFATQAGFSITLASLAPITVLWYCSWGNYTAAILFNGILFACASLCTLFFLRRYYRPLIARNPVHARLLYAWIALYIFVGIQMGWLLRPFIGSPDEPLQLIRPDTWGNAYIEIWGLFIQLYEQVS